jgi:hypothetical protein
LRDALAAGGYRGQYRGAQFLGQFGDIDGNAARRRFVVHVQGEHHGHAEFGQQGAQGQRAAQVLGVAHLHQAAYRLAEQGAHGGRSSSLREGRARTPGVSSSSALASKRAVARVTSTVVPG